MKNSKHLYHLVENPSDGGRPDVDICDVADVNEPFEANLNPKESAMKKKDTRLFAPGEKRCDHCGDPMMEAVETWKGHTHTYCTKPECREAGMVREKGRWVVDGEIACMAPSCKKFVPEGSYGRRTQHFVCSIRCWHSLRYYMFRVLVPFECKWCGKAGMGQIPPGKSGPLFCSIDHAGRYRREETLKSSGRFRPILDRYIAGLPDRYRGASMGNQIQRIAKHLKFLDEVGITSLEEVTVMTIPEYAEWGRKNGSTSILARTDALTDFYNWLIAIGDREGPVPVNARIHRRRQHKRLPRPYDEKTIEFIWSLLVERGNSRLRAVAAIALESGMRRTEICNIKLSHVDLDCQEIFVGTPNKTDTERIARFGELTKHYVQEWMGDRDPNCGHEFLFHNTEGNQCKGLALHLEFKHVLCKELRGKRLHDQGLETWSIHRMRHTMATRLAKGGASFNTIMVAGGWKTPSAMIGYTALDPEDARKGYEEAMQRVVEGARKSSETTTLSLDELLSHTRKLAA